MKTLNLYVTKNLLFIIAIAIVILTFGMVGGNMIRVFQLVAAGIPLGNALKFAVYILPMVFSFTIPWGILIAVLLMFGKMSADNEITAMRACGISIFQIISPLIILTFGLTIICIFLQADLSPHFMGKARMLIKFVGYNDPAALIMPGQPNELNNVIVYVKNKGENNTIKDIQVFVFDKDKQNIEQDITASNGLVKVDKEKGTTSIILYNYYIINYQGDLAKDRIYGKEFTIIVNVERELNEMPLSRRIDFLTYKELIGRIMLYKKAGIDTTEAEVTLNLMFAMGLSPIAFLLLGFPLAIRTSRKETSIGLFVSVILSGIYFFFIIACNTLSSYPKLCPQILLWIPNVVYQIGGLYFLYRITKR